MRFAVLLQCNENRFIYLYWIMWLLACTFIWRFSTLFNSKIFSTAISLAMAFLVFFSISHLCNSHSFVLGLSIWTQHLLISVCIHTYISLCLRKNATILPSNLPILFYKLYCIAFINLQSFKYLNIYIYTILYWPIFLFLNFWFIYSFFLQCITISNTVLTVLSFNYYANSNIKQFEYALKLFLLLIITIFLNSIFFIIFVKIFSFWTSVICRLPRLSLSKFLTVPLRNIIPITLI